jgi:hypothetical protein
MSQLAQRAGSTASAGGALFTGVGLPLRGGARMAGMSRMSREAHVRICGGLEVKFLRSTRPADSGPLESRFLAELMTALAPKADLALE